MKGKISLINDVKKKEEDLNNLISGDGHIKRNNIIEAEDISYNNNFKNLKYDQYGFVDSNQDL